MKLDDFFPHQVCINLEKRADRWRQMQAKFAAHDLKRVVRFPAADGRKLAIPTFWDDYPGAYGCLRSHLAAVEQARAAAWPSILIFEDDAVLAPETDLRGATTLAERLCADVAAATIELPDGRELSVTASVGVAVKGDLDRAEKLVAAADEALYEAKRGGKNRVMVADPQREPATTVSA